MGPGRPGGGLGVAFRAMRTSLSPVPGTQGRIHPGADPILGPIPSHTPGQSHPAPFRAASRAVWGCWEDPSQAGPFWGRWDLPRPWGWGCALGSFLPFSLGAATTSHTASLGELPARWRWGDPEPFGTASPDEH